LALKIDPQMLYNKNRHRKKHRKTKKMGDRMTNKINNRPSKGAIATDNCSKSILSQVQKQAHSSQQLNKRLKPAAYGGRNGAMRAVCGNHVVAGISFTCNPNQNLEKPNNSI
jgi:hypothetical protein